MIHIVMSVALITMTIGSIVLICRQVRINRELIRLMRKPQWDEKDNASFQNLVGGK